MLTLLQAQTALNSGKLSKRAEATVRHILNNRLAQKGLIANDVTDALINDFDGSQDIRHNPAYVKSKYEGIGRALENNAFNSSKLEAVNPDTGEAMPLADWQTNIYADMRSANKTHTEAISIARFNNEDSIRAYVKVKLGRKVPNVKTVTEWIEKFGISHVLTRVEEHIRYWANH